MTAQMDPDGGHRKNLGDEMLSLQEACVFLRVPEGTLRYWRHLGCGPRSFKVGRHVRRTSGSTTCATTSPACSSPAALT